jgi:hypothetical protein
LDPRRLPCTLAVAGWCPGIIPRLLTTAINSLGFAGFDKYIWKPAAAALR